MDQKKLIEEVLFNGCLYSKANTEGYAIGTGYGCGNKKEFYYPYSESLEYTYCTVSVAEIEEVRADIEKRGWTFDVDGDYVMMHGERKAFKPFIASPPIANPEHRLNPNTDPVGYYTERLFTKSKDGNLGLF